MPSLLDFLNKGIWEGSGQVAKTFIMQRSTGGLQIRSYFIPTNPQTAPQQAWRTKFKQVCNEWNALPELQKQFYREFAKKNYPQMYGFNVFAKKRLKELY